MPIKILVLENHEILGDLISEWATGEPTTPGNPVEPRPTTVDELHDLLVQRGAGPTWPNGRPEHLDYDFRRNDTLTIAVPTAEMVNEGEDLARLISTDTTYPAAKKYDNIFVDPTRKPNMTDLEWNEIYRARLGDYTIAKCM